MNAGVKTETSATQSNIWVMIEREDGQLVPVRYDQFVLRLFKPDTRNAMIAHAAMGVAGEVGELVDVLKKHTAYGQSLDTVMKEDGRTLFTHIIEELGDAKFYLQAIQNLFGITDQEVHQHNADKLSTRYKNLVYSDAAAEARADKGLNAAEQNKF